MATESNILIVFHLARPVQLYDVIIVTCGVFTQDQCELVNLKMLTLNEWNVLSYLATLACSPYAWYAYSITLTFTSSLDKEYTAFPQSSPAWSLFMVCIAGYTDKIHPRHNSNWT